MTRVAGVTLPGRILVASGCGGTGRELADLGPLPAVGGFVTRSLTVEARPGGPLPRIVEVPGGVLHAGGLPNPGINLFLSTELPWLAQLGVKVFCSLAAAAVTDFEAMAHRLATAPGVTGVELNLGAPDAAQLGLIHASDPARVAEVVEAVRGRLASEIPVLVKLSAVDARTPLCAQAAAAAGASAVVVGHGLPAELPDGRPGALSGPALGPVVRRSLREVAAAVPGLDLIAGGGVRTPADVRATLAAGAAAVQVGTALLSDPSRVFTLAEEDTP